MKQSIFTFLLLLLVSIPGFCQTRPFPQNVTYKYGYRPDNYTYQNARAAYTKWKSLFLVKCNGYYRVDAGNNQTLSESMGYGMLLTAYYGDKTYFDGLLKFYNSKRTTTADGLMAWKVTCNDIVDPNSATDGDIDVAFSLIIAYEQWGGDYLKEAKNIIGIIKNNYITTCNNVKTLYPGAGWGGCGLTDISYYTPAYFRIFAQVTNDDVWNQLADDTYILLNNSANPTTGLVPDWQSASGIPGGSLSSGRKDYYSYDASRVPWRISLDYLWNGNTKALDWEKKITTWANSIGASNIKSGYKLDGTVVGQYNNSAFVGGFAVGAMCNSQTMVDNFASRLAYLENVGWDNTYYNLSLRSLYALVLTGNFWKPAISTTGIHKNLDNQVRVYPNPMTDNEVLTISGFKNVESIEIINMIGQVVKRLQIYNHHSPLKVNVSMLQKGYYLIRIQDKVGMPYVMKWVKKN